MDNVLKINIRDKNVWPEDNLSNERNTIIQSRLNHFQAKFQPKRHKDVYPNFFCWTINNGIEYKASFGNTEKNETITVCIKTNGVIIRNGKSEVPKLPCSTLSVWMEITFCGMKADQRQWLQPLWRKKVATLFIFGHFRIVILCTDFLLWSIYLWSWYWTWDIALVCIYSIKSSELNVLWCDHFDSTAHDISAYISAAYSIYQTTWNESVDNKSVMKCFRLMSFLFFSSFDFVVCTFDLSWLQIRYFEHWTPRKCLFYCVTFIAALVMHHYR